MKIKKSEKGFTLVELVIVLVIVAIFSGVISVSVDDVNSNVQLSNAANMAQADVRYAQELAMMYRREVDVLVYAGSDSYRIIWHDTGTAVESPLDGSSMVVSFGTGDFSDVYMSSGLSSRLSFTATGEPLMGGSRFTGELSVMYLNSKVHVVVNDAGYVFLQTTASGGGCGVCAY